MYNRILLISFLSWVSSLLCKTIIFWIVNKRFDPKRCLGDGGMPSSHSATVVAVAVATGMRCGWDSPAVVTALATAIGLQCGMDSPVFAVATVFAIIVMHDAMGVRQETGKQARVINNMLQLFESMGRGDLTPDEALKEFVGHTGRQVIVGAILGILMALLLHSVLP